MTKTKNFQKETRSLVYKDDNTEYGLVVKKLGNARFQIRLNLTNREVVGKLCGRLKQKSTKKQNWVQVDSVILVSLRDFQDNVVDIVHVYDINEARCLKKQNHIFFEESILHNNIDNKINNEYEDIIFEQL